MKEYHQDLPPIPKRLLSLPTERGYPVPWFVVRVNGVYDFRCIDGSKMQPAIHKKLCWICGQKLGAYLAFGIGPMCAINKTISEPPSHRECMEWAMRACPFLTQRSLERRETNVPENVELPPGIAIKRQPGVVALWITKSYKVFNVSNGLLFKLGDPLEVHWMREGRPATRAECLESIDSGYPLLLEATQHDESGIRELERLRREVMELLPA
jgi:hypothetical protein